VPRKKNSRQWARLRILCYAGLDLMTIVQDAFALVRELIPNSSAHLALAVPVSAPAPAPATAIDGAPMAPSFVQVLPPPEGYYFSDHASLRAPNSPPEYVLEAPLKSGGQRLGTITLWRHDGPSFDHHDQEDLARVATYFEHVLRHVPDLGTGNAGVVEDEAMLLATSDGQILYLSDSAGTLLDQLAAQERQVFNRARCRRSACALWSRWCTATAIPGCCHSGFCRWPVACSKRARSG